jgi:hypothetical protein
LTGIAIPASRWLERRRWLGDLAVVVSVTAAALLTAYAVHTGRLVLALAVALLPLAVWESTRLTGALILLGATVPFVGSIGGESASSLNIAVSDLVLVFLILSLLARSVVTGSMPEFAALRPVAVPVIQYSVSMFLLLVVHAGVAEGLEAAQRFELFLVPMIVGAFAALTDRHVAVLKAFVISATLLAGIWPFQDFSLNKNAVAHITGLAIVVLVAFQPLKRFVPCLLVLVPGLLVTESRGAVAATAIGLAALVFVRDSRGHMVLTRVAPLAVIATAAFFLLPPSAQERLTTFSPSSEGLAARTPSVYNLNVRTEYAKDAREVIAANEWTGVGIGNYIAGDPSDLTQSEDPHQVLLLQAAEGGYLFAASFVLLVAGCAYALYRMRRLDIAPVAIGVFVATVAHGLVDIYWVRGTPVLAWLLVGMTCGAWARTARSSTER